MATTHLRQVLRHLRDTESLSEASDAELLVRFTAGGEEAAFAALVRRHGGMVLGVARRALPCAEDAEDVFQATFLVLARKAASIRKRESVGGWLHGVAHRVALRLRDRDARRRQRERRAADMRDTGHDSGAAWPDVREALDAALGQLPKKYRAALVLCYLEGKTHQEAARLLGCPLATLRTHIARGRTLLRKRLTARGLALSAAGVAALLIASTAPAGTPAALVKAAARVAVPFAAGQSAAALCSPRVAGLVRGGLRTVLAGKVKLATILMLAASLVVAGARALSHQAVAGSKEKAKSRAAAEVMPPEKAKPRAADEGAGAVEVRGRVLDPDGNPLAGAKLFLASPLQEVQPRPPSAAVQATSGRDGRFRFRARPEVPGDMGVLVATAEGYGAGWAPAGAGKDMTVKLARDDVPIAGRIIDLQGRPVRGATVRVLHLRMALNPGTDDLSAFLDTLKGRKDGYAPPEYGSSSTAMALPCGEFPTLPQTAATDADGRFRLRGVGRERMAVVLIQGPGIAAQEVRILTRATAPRHLLDAERNADSSLDYYGATFTHAALPGRAVAGVVRDRDTKKPLAGFTVRTYKTTSQPSDGRPLAEATTDSEGRYRLAGMPPKGKDIRIVAMPTGGECYLAASKVVPEAGGLGDVTVDFDVRHGVCLTGKVTDEATSRPVRCLVAYNTFEDNPHFKDPFALFTRQPAALTGDDGAFRLVVLPGRGLIGAIALSPNYCLGAGADRIKEGLDVAGNFLTYPSRVAPRDFHALVEVSPARQAKDFTCNLVLRPGRTRTGTVLGPDGKPLAGARVMGLASASQWWEQEPLRTAEFTVRGLETDRARLVQFVHEQRQLAGFVVIRPGDNAPLTVKLAPAGTLTGRLVTRQGRPLADLEVVGLSDDPPLRPAGPKQSPPAGSFPRRVRSGKDGRFRIEGLAPGMKYSLTVVQAPYRLDPSIVEAPTIEAGEMKDLGDVRIRPLE